MEALARKAKQTIDRHAMLGRGDRVLIAVSGGADSVCLLHILLALRKKYGLTLALCHLDHMIRGKSAEEDALFVAGMAAKAGLRLFQGRKNAPLRAERSGRCLEEAGRDLRYGFFLETAAKNGFNRIALGHTGSDQAETVLMNLIRGSGLRGLGGIPPVRSAGRPGLTIIRPLIEISRREAEDFLQDRGISFRTDPSNLSLDYLRNRIRLCLLPGLEADYSPGIEEKLCKLAEIAREDENCIGARAGEEAERLAEAKDGLIEIPLGPFNSLHPSIRKRVLLEALGMLGYGRRALSYAALGRILEIALSEKPNLRTCPVPGVSVRREYGILRMQRTQKSAAEPFPEYIFDSMGRHRPPGTGMVIEAAVLNRSGEGGAWSGDGRRASFDRDRLEFPLTIRPRKKGDRFSPLGMKGTKKLKDMFIDRKIPAGERDSIPVLADARGRIIWVMDPENRCSLIGERVKVSESTKRVLEVKIV